MSRVGNSLWLGIFLNAAAVALTNPLADGIQHCAAESDQVKRLACFDTLATTVPKVKADAIGLTAEIEHKRAPASEVAATGTTPINALHGKIASTHTGPAGKLIFTLDNQQVWAQTQTEPGKHFAVGDDVRIEPGAMGSWWLAADKARKTRVKRIS